MGRILEVLRKAGTMGRAPARSPVRDEVPLVEMEEEVPYIEVGPKHWFEASPAVLATVPVAEPTTRRPSPEDSEPVLTVAEPVAWPTAARLPNGVRLRPVPGSASRLAPELVAFHHPEHPLSGQYRELASALVDVAQPTVASQALLFTAVRGEVGTSTVVLNLAISLARANHSVVVVDGNLKKPAIAQRLGLPEAPGLREVLANTISLEVALRRTAQPGLSALAAGVKPATAIRNAAPDIAGLLKELRQRADFVLVDAPSWDGRPELVLFGAHCDAVYLIVPETEAECPEATALCQLIPEQGGRLAGCILARF